MPGAPLRMVHNGIFMLLFLTVAGAMIVKFPEQTLPPNIAPWARKIDEFHFLAHATVNFTFEIAPASDVGTTPIGNSSQTVMFLLGCQDDVMLTQRMLAELCRTGSSASVADQCILVVPAPAQYWEELPDQVMLRLSMLKCPSSSPFKIGGQLEVAQPDGRYLSAELRYYPLMYLLLMLVWAPPTVWFLRLHFMHSQTASVWQKYLFLLPTLKLAVMALSFVHYWSIDREGSKTQFMPYFVNTSKTAFSLTFYGMILLFSKGLLVTRAYLHYPEIRMAVIIVLGHSLSSLVAGGGTAPYLWGFWLLTLMCLTVLIVSSSYRTTQNLRMVTLQTARSRVSAWIVGVRPGERALFFGTPELLVSRSQGTLAGAGVMALTTLGMLQVKTHEAVLFGFPAYVLLTIICQIWLFSSDRSFVYAQSLLQLLVELIQMSFIAWLVFLWRVRTPYNLLFMALPARDTQPTGEAPPPIVRMAAAGSTPSLTAGGLAPPAKLTARHQQCIFIVINPGSKLNTQMAAPVLVVKQRHVSPRHSNRRKVGASSVQMCIRKPLDQGAIAEANNSYTAEIISDEEADEEGPLLMQRTDR